MLKFGKTSFAMLRPAAAFLPCSGLAAEAQSTPPLPINRPVSVDGVQIACTGIGFGSENNPRWRNYPVKLEMVNGRGQYLAYENVILFDRKAAGPIQLRCDAPWVLMQLPAGRYEANVTLSNGRARRVSFNVPRYGQRDVVVRFPNQGEMAGLPM